MATLTEEWAPAGNQKFVFPSGSKGKILKVLEGQRKVEMRLALPYNCPPITTTVPMSVLKRA